MECRATISSEFIAFLVMPAEAGIQVREIVWISFVPWHSSVSG
jgi:hypothetical protein